MWGGGGYPCGLLSWGALAVATDDWLLRPPPQPHHPPLLLPFLLTSRQRQRHLENTLKIIIETSNLWDYWWKSRHRLTSRKTKCEKKIKFRQSAHTVPPWRMQFCRRGTMQVFTGHHVNVEHTTVKKSNPNWYNISLDILLSVPWFFQLSFWVKPQIRSRWWSYLRLYYRYEAFPVWVGSFLNESSLSPDWADTPQPPFTQLATPKYLPRHSKSSYIYIYVDTSLGLCPKKYCASISSTYPVGT